MAENEPDNGWDALAWIAAGILLVNAIPITVMIWRGLW